MHTYVHYEKVCIVNCKPYRLNEGWTTYLERKIVAKLYGEKERHLRAISKSSHIIMYMRCSTLKFASYYLADGWKALKDAVSDTARKNPLIIGL